MNKRLLFVDDEPFVLRSLKLLLRNYTNRWDMVFAVGGKAGLAELENGPFDLVMTDMRMGAVDGAQLLEQVAQRWPNARRVVLSGFADAEAEQRGMRFAHKWLHKPCTLDELLATLKEVDFVETVTVPVKEPVALRRERY